MICNISVGVKMVMAIIETTETELIYPQIPDGESQVQQRDKVKLNVVKLNEDTREIKMPVLETEEEIGNQMTGPNHLPGKDTFT